MMERSSSVKSCLFSAAAAAAWAMTASVLFAIWLSMDCPSIDVRPSGFMWSSDSTPKLADVPPRYSVRARYSPARSKMMIWASGLVR